MPKKKLKKYQLLHFFVITRNIFYFFIFYFSFFIFYFSFFLNILVFSELFSWLLYCRSNDVMYDVECVGLSLRHMPPGNVEQPLAAFESLRYFFLLQ